MRLTTDLFKVFLLMFTFCLAGGVTSLHAGQSNQLKGLRAWPSPDNTRVVLDLSKKPNYKIHYLSKPDRLVLDLNSTSNKVDLSKIVNDGPLVKKLRTSASGSKGTYRLVIDLNYASKASVFVLPPADPYGHRLVIDLPHTEKKKLVALPPANISMGRDVIVAIDAGHGGDDPGALGRFSYEKTVTLQIARRLQKRVNSQKGMKAFLIRTGDYYVNLDKRSELAVKGNADFLVSIHADGFTSSQPSGASVWILSDRRANSEMGRRMERHEVHSELLGGKGQASNTSSSDPFLNKVFFDMSKSNSMEVGSNVGSLVVNELNEITHMHKKRPVGASLAVLKSPYIPSILVEAGFITNHREERLLNQAEFQNKISNAVFKGIYKHFKLSPPHDSLFAQKKRAIKHTVRSGESLSVLSERYSVSSAGLKSYNGLKSSALRIGQVLNIPPDYQLLIKQDPVKTVAVAPRKPIVHKVKKGEYLSLIAAKYGSTSRELKSFNKLRSSSLSIGQKLKIPNKGDTVAVQVAKVEAKPIVHKVKSGESLSVIAAKYGSTSRELKSFNNLRSTSLLIGQKLKIPNNGYTPAVQVAQVQAKPIVHKVKSGESLSVIAAKYGSTSRELKSFNKLRSTSLAIGQKLKIPNKGYMPAVQVAQVQAKPIVHKVKSGESLSVIAAKYGSTSRELKSFNKLRSTSLAIGQKLKIPNNGYTPAVQVAQVQAKPIVHKVKSGESLSVIAAKYGSTSRELKSFNKLRSTSLSIGQKLKIPNKGYKAPVQVAKTKAKPTVHKVKRGESLSVIASFYGTNSAVLKKYNGLKKSSLSIGQKIKIPSSLNKLKRHKVKSGESLSVIARRYGTTTHALKKFNRLSSSSLAVGQLLTIPTT